MGTFPLRYSLLESEYRESSILPTLSTMFWNRDAFVCASSSSVASYKRNLVSSALPSSVLDEPYVIGLVRHDAGGCIIILAGEKAIVRRNVALIVTSVVIIAVLETYRRRRRDGDHIIPTMEEVY